MAPYALNLLKQRCRRLFLGSARIFHGVLFLNDNPGSFVVCDRCCVVRVCRIFRRLRRGFGVCTFRWCRLSLSGGLRGYHARGRIRGTIRGSLCNRRKPRLLHGLRGSSWLRRFIGFRLCRILRQSISEGTNRRIGRTRLITSRRTQEYWHGWRFFDMRCFPRLGAAVILRRCVSLQRRLLFSPHVRSLSLLVKLFVVNRRSLGGRRS